MHHVSTRKIHVSLLALAAGTVVATASAPALAQNTEIVVTARKVEENLQDVPVAVTAFSGETFEEAGLSEFSDISRLTPNFDVRPRGTTGALFANLTIRGQTSGFLTLNADQAVGISINNAPITRGTSLFTNLFDIERIEVLKGPQGTLYGKNTTGGAVNVVTKGPELDEINGYGQFTYGSYDRTDAQLVANIPLVQDQLGIRLGAALTHRDGFGRGVATGRELADDNEIFLRGSLLYEPSDTFSVRVNADYHDVDESISIFRSLRSAFLDLGFAVIPIALETTDPDFYAGSDFRTEAPFARSDEFNINATANLEIGNANLQSITSYRKQNSLTLVQSAPSTSVTLGQNSDLFAQEIRLSGQAFDDRLTWQVGGFYSTETGEDIDNVGGFQTTAAKNEGWSLFTQNSFAITDQLQFTLGLRYTNEDREVRDISPVVTGLLQNSASFDALSWLASLDFKPTDETLFYASVSRGFRSGAVDQDNLATIVNPEYVLNYELGLKADLFDNRVRFNSSVFYSDYTDIQRTAFDPDSIGTTGVPTTVLRNAAEATIWGFEGELHVAPFDGLSFGATVGYTNAQFDEFLDFDAAGNQIDRTNEPLGGPEWQYSLNGRYEFYVSDSATLGIQANYFWIGEDVLAAPSVIAILAPGEGSVPSFGLLNGQIDLDVEQWGGLNIAVFGTNILDKEYYVGGVALGLFGGISNRIVGEPQQWGIRVTKGF
ncbi:TonB-dependent receptor domain-containing protein [uncultured Parasphingorhabdus sp.]|uniref:TonB-dependent receptor n=1 Tax=uncultured Parasphingorhabdus sp. TaxID=2709694 RepID=UPI002AA7C093|nr:TonB-dependent receptor [uncultured Parasphingorhabdus sp.]